MRLLLGLAALVVGAHTVVNGVTSARGAKEVKNIAIIGKFNEQTFLKIHIGLMHWEKTAASVKEGEIREGFREELKTNPILYRCWCCRLFSRLPSSEICGRRRLDPEYHAVREDEPHRRTYPDSQPIQ
jgi:hypothetical protein